jgi:hypothetical protein
VSFFFSLSLISEIIQCFKDENGLDISQEQASEYLNSFADLYLVFAESKSKDKNPPPAPLRGQAEAIAPLANCLR